MSTTSPSTSAVVAVAEPMFTSQERLVLAGFPAGYTGLTREACALVLRQYATWCHQRHIRLFEGRRADIECFARDLEAKGRGPGDGHPPAVHDRRVLPVRGRRRPA
jgi:hypothetical protein